MPPIMLQVRYGHTGPINSIAWSPDGSRIASAGGGEGTPKHMERSQLYYIENRDFAVRIWDATLFQLVHVLQGHTERVASVAWSPDAKKLASGSWDNTVRIWDSTTGCLSYLLKGHTGEVNSITWSPDGTRIASGGDDKTIRIWDAVSGTPIQVLGNQAGWVTSLSWSPDGCFIAGSVGGCGTPDEIVLVWDITTGRVSYLLKGHTAEVLSIAWSPDGIHIASGAYDNTVRVWNATTGRVLHILARHTAGVLSIAWSPDGTHIASGAYDNTVRVWDVTTGHLKQSLKGHTSHVNSIAWGKTGSFIVSGSNDKTIRIWDSASGHLIHVLNSWDARVNSVAWNSDSSRFASGGLDKKVRIWDAVSGRLIYALDGHSREVKSVAWSADSESIISCGLDSIPRRWQAKSGRVTHLFDNVSNTVLQAARKQLRSLKFPPLLDYITDVVFLSLALSPDGNLIACGAGNGTVWIWEVKSGRLIQILVGHKAMISSVSWSPDGSRLASGAMDKRILIWDLATGRFFRALDGHTDGVAAVAWSPDGMRLASGGWDPLGKKMKKLRVWDATSGRLIEALDGHIHGISSISWSPDASRIGSGGHDRTVRVWDTVSGDLIQVLDGGDSSISSVSWSPDASRIAGAGYDSTVRIWDCSNGRLIATFLHLPNEQWLTYTPGGHFIGDEESIRMACYWFEKDGIRQPAHRGSIMESNPSPEKVAESLAVGDVRRRQPTEKPAEHKPVGQTAMSPLHPTNIVVLLGAGASKPFGGPLMSEIIDQVDSDLKNWDQDTQLVWQQLKDICKEDCDGVLSADYLIRKTHAIGTKKEGLVFMRPSARAEFDSLSKRNIRVSRDWIARNVLGYDETDDRCLDLHASLRAGLVSPIIAMRRNPKNDSALYCYRKLFDELGIRHYLTTNFDSVIEDTFLSMGIVVNDGFGGNDIFNTELLTRQNSDLNSSINVLHVHGSLFWKIKKAKKSNNDFTIVRDLSCDDALQYTEHAGKTVLYSSVYDKISVWPFKDLFHIGFNWLSQCDVCISIGYSFSDNHINELFSRAINYRHSPMLLILISPNSSSLIRDRFDYLSGANVEVVESRFSTSNMPHIISQAQEFIKKYYY